MCTYVYVYTYIYKDRYIDTYIGPKWAMFIYIHINFRTSAHWHIQTHEQSQQTSVRHVKKEKVWEHSRIDDVPFMAFVCTKCDMKTRHSAAPCWCVCTFCEDLVVGLYTGAVERGNKQLLKYLYQFPEFCMCVNEFVYTYELAPLSFCIKVLFFWLYAKGRHSICYKLVYDLLCAPSPFYLSISPLLPFSECYIALCIRAFTSPLHLYPSTYHLSMCPFLYTSVCSACIHFHFDSNSPPVECF